MIPIDEPPPIRCIHCGEISDDYKIIRKTNSPALVEYSCSNGHQWSTLLKAERHFHGSQEGGKEEGGKEEGSGKGSAQEHWEGKNEDVKPPRQRKGDHPS